MKYYRGMIPFFGFIAIVALFFKLPEVSSFFDCKMCTSSDPYLPLLGAGYFSIITVLSLVFPGFPTRLLAYGGVFWAILLAGVLSFLAWPLWCINCLISHAAHILIWIIWLFTPVKAPKLSSTFGERLCLTFFAPLIVMTFFAALNLTFMVYDFHPAVSTSLKPGDSVPQFAIEDTSFAVNFIAPDCPYCKEQLPMLNSMAAQCKIINVSPVLTKELVQQLPNAEWVEDKDGNLRKRFKVKGYPTLFLVDRHGKIEQIIAGVPDKLETSL